MTEPGPRWLEWGKRLQALAQTGLAYTEGPYDRLRYQEIREVAAEILAEQSDTPHDRILELFAAQKGYATPKVDVRAVVFRDDGLLLVRERDDGLWTLPGGWADVLASPAENVIREVQEETGFQARVVRLLAVYDRSRHPHQPPFPFHVYKLFFQCEIVGGVATVSNETSEVAFFREDELPPLSLSRVLPTQIIRFWEHRRNPGWPTDWD